MFVLVGELVAVVIVTEYELVIISIHINHE